MIKLLSRWRIWGWRQNYIYQKEISNAASSLDSSQQDAAIKKTQEDLQKLVNMSSEIKNNSNNNQYRKEEHCKKN